MKTGQNFFLKNIFVCLLLAMQNIQAQEASSIPELKKDVRKPVDSSWNQFLSGGQRLANGQLLKPAGQSLSLTKGTRVLNLEFARHNNILIAKTNKQLSIIDAKNFKTCGYFDYFDKESGSMNGLAVDKNDSTIYFTGLEKNLYIGNVS